MSNTIVWTLAICCAMLGTCVTRARGDHEPVIPEVTTLRELEERKPLDAGNGWAVRLGYGGGGDVAGPWLILCCLAEYVGDDAPRIEVNGNVPGQFLGPVSFTWGSSKLPVHAQVKAHVPLTERRGLFCATLPADWSGATSLIVRSGAGKILAQRTVQLRGGRAPLWHTFAAGEWAAREVKQPTFVHDMAGAAFPMFSGMITLPDKPDEGDGKAAVALAGPGVVLDGEGLRLSREGHVFVIHAARDMVNWPDLQVLARWWVNGRAAVAPHGQRSAQRVISRQVVRAKEMRVRFGLPDNLGHLKAGDRVGLQVLYAPGGIATLTGKAGLQPWPTHGLSDDEHVDKLLLSNRLEFEITEELLEHADHAPPAPAQ